MLNPNPLRSALLLAPVLVSLAAAASCADGGFTPMGIYGPDDRQESSAVKSPVVRSWVDSTVALFQAGSVKDDPEKKTSALTLKPFEKAVVRMPDNPFGGTPVDLCPEEPYKGQSKGAFCSGSLVAADLVMTAGHCIETEEECQGVKFVFGFAAGKDGQPAGSVPTDEVYSCSKLVVQELDGKGPDFAIVRLDRQVKNHTPLRVRRSGAPPAGTPLTVIGHPVGLPTKVAGGASIRKDDEGGFFAGNLDTYGGNSGSAVINSATGEVEGILVRGGADFEYDETRKCARSVRKMNDTGRGEDVTLVANVLEHIPDNHKPRGLDAPMAGGALETLSVASAGSGPF
ncbi:MAG: trypsin-like peptidase domain-containing protein [Elusimicrobia bacterium]|nr:trypsin-like peptidase domain-containing protein [Elusimicrobiota bacterium]